MPLSPNDFQTVYDIVKNRITTQFPDADFTEGSFNDIYSGAIALIYQELQAYGLEQFSKTFIDNPQTLGEDLENLAIDHYHEEIARPDATKAVGILILTREAGNTDAITITTDNVFSVDTGDYVPVRSYDILGATQVSSIEVIAVEAGLVGNLLAGQTWSTTIPDVVVTNTEVVTGGLATLNDEDYKTYIHNYISSVQDGTAQGLEGTAKLVPGIFDARVIRKLVDVGTLDIRGRLQTGADLFRFKAIRLLIYVAGRTSTSINTALKNLVDTRINEQLSAGEYIQSIIATPIVVDWNVTLTFDVTNPIALTLASRKNELLEAFKEAINDLRIGVNFERIKIASTVLANNGWTGFFTVVTNLPVGDLIIDESEKAIAGNVEITIV